MKNSSNTLFPLVLLGIALSMADLRGAVTQFTFSNGFSGANERPTPIASSGTFVINTLRFDDSIGAFGRFDVNISFNGLVAAASNAHIHGYTNVNFSAGVVQGLSFTAATSGTVSGPWSPANAAQVSALFNGLTYINLHSTTFPGGEWRGQLAPVPEPSAFAFCGLGALLVVALRRRLTRSGGA